MEINKEYPAVGKYDIGIINNTGGEVNVVAFELDKVMPNENGDVLAWKVTRLAAGENTAMNAVYEYSAQAFAENIQSNEIKLELPGGDYYELNAEFELSNIGILGELQPTGSFYFRIPPEVIQKYKNQLSLNIIRGGDPVIIRKHFLEFSMFEYSFGVFLGCVPGSVEQGKPFYENELISNRASVQCGETVEIWKDDLGKVQITPAQKS